jgi:hypothetical protein
VSIDALATDSLAAYVKYLYGKDHDMSKKKYHPNDTVPTLADNHHPIKT